ncbi:MAG: radical SAM protein [Candidatus Omnitrophota bacterium]
MKILLIEPPGELRAQGFFPLGLMYLQAYLKRHDYPGTFIRRLSRSGQMELLGFIEEIRPDVVGIPCLTGYRFSSFAMAEAVKMYDPKILVVLGGQHATYLREQILKEYPFIDYIVRGEGEESFRRLLDHLSTAGCPREIAGVSGRDPRGRVSEGPLRECISDLDSLPFPCYDDIAAIGGAVRRFNVLASRGCMYSCSFCSAADFFGARWRRRSAQNIVAELRYLKNTFNPHEIVFNDDCLTADLKHSHELFDLVSREDFNFRFYIDARIDLLDKGLLRKMKEAGVSHIIFGLESGAPGVLQAVNRRFLFDKARDMVYEAKRLGIMTRANVIVGWPGQGYRAVLETARALNELNPYYFKITPLIIFPGTVLYREAKDKGIISELFWLKKLIYPVYAVMRKKYFGRIHIYLESLFLLVSFLGKTRSLRRFSIVLREKLQQRFDYFRLIGLGRSWKKHLKARGFPRSVLHE